MNLLNIFIVLISHCKDPKLCVNRKTLRQEQILLYLFLEYKSPVITNKAELT